MEAFEEGSDAVDHGVDGSSRVLSQQGFELGERHLDWVQVRAVGRQVEELGTTGGDGLADTGDAMGRQIVEDHDIAAFEGGGEDVADIDPKGIAIHRTIQYPWRGHAAEPEAGDERHRLPVAKRDGIAATLADRGPAIESRHLGVDASLIEEDEAPRVDEGLGCLPQRPPCGHVGAILLGCAQSFF